MIWIVVVYVALFIGACAACLHYFPPATNTKFFLGALTVGVSAVTALMSSIVAIYTSMRAEKAATKLEDHKQEILKRIEDKKAELAKNLADHNQDLQKELQSITDISKRELAKLQEITLKREIEVYQDLYAAADHCYAALSKLQSSEWTYAESRAAEAEMERARSKLPYMESVDHRTLWEKIWTRALSIAKEAIHTSKNDQPVLWKKHCAEFGAMLQELEAIVAAKFPRPKTS